MATQINEEQIPINEEGRFVLAEYDPFPKPLITISERLFEIITEEINKYSDHPWTIRNIVQSQQGTFPLMGRTVFLTLTKKSLSDLFPMLVRLFPFSQAYHLNLSNMQIRFMQDEKYQSLFKAVRTRFNTESLAPQPLFEAYQQLGLIDDDEPALVGEDFKLLCQRPPQEIADQLFDAIVDHDSNMTKEVVRSNVQTYEIVQRKIWIAVILKEIYEKKLSYNKIGEIISEDPKSHSTINHYIMKRHPYWMDKSINYKYGFNLVRIALCGVL